RRGTPRVPARGTTAPMGRRTGDLVVQPLSQAAHPVGEEAAELPRPRALRRGHRRVARTCGIGSKAVRGVASATPILNVGAFLGSRGGGRWYSYIIGVHSEERRGGPWGMVRGQALPGPGEAVIPDVLAKKAKLGIGSTINALGRAFAIVGISTD